MTTRTTHLTRRTLLSGAAGTALATLLAACGSDAPAATATTVAPTRAATTAPATTAPVASTVGASTAAPTIAPTVAATVAVAAATQPPAATSTAPAPTTAASAAASPATTGSAVASPVATFKEATAVGTPVSVKANADYRGKLSVKSLAIAFIPSNDSDAIFERYKDFLAYIKESFGVEVKGTVGSSYSAVIEAMRAKKVDIAYYGPFSYILAHQEANAQVLVLPADKDGNLTTYTSSIIAPADSPINTLADLRGKRLSFVDAASTSGHLVPAYNLLMKVGLKENTDYKFVYAGSHPASYLAVVNNKVDAGAVSTSTLTAGIMSGAVEKSKYKVLDESLAIPNSPIAVRGDLSKSDFDTLRQFYLSLNDLPKESNIYKAVFSGATVKWTIGDDSVYNELRKIPPLLGIDIKMLD